MIISFEKETQEIEQLFDKELTSEQSLELAFILFRALDRGVAFERERCISIIQKLSVNAMDVVREIRKPLR